RLGHAEFFADGCEGGWRVTPPIWAGTRSEGDPSAILCGARTLPLLTRVRSVNVSLAVLETHEDAGAPTVYRLTASDRDRLIAASVGTGIPISFDTPRAMLCTLTPVTESYTDVAEMPLGRDWVVEQFDSETLRWKPSSREQASGSAEGLFRFRLSYQRRHFLR